MRLKPLFLCLLLALTGCNSMKSTKFPDNFETKIPASHQIKNFPHIEQRDNYSCATTSLAIVMSYYDNQTYGKSDVWKASGSSITEVSKVCGNDMNGLKAAAKKYGFTSYEFVRGMSIDELKYMISQGIPVVVNIKNFWKESFHAVVVTGYDEEDFTFVDPASSLSSYKIDYQTFGNKWYASLCTPRGERQSHTAFLLYPKAQ